MEPLDLTIKPPRGPREKLAGIGFLPRTIDKMRAFLPGGNPGGYVVMQPSGMSALVCGRLGVDLEGLRAEVERAASEDEVAEWVRKHADMSKTDDVNALLEKLSVDRLPEDFQAAVVAAHPVMKDRPGLKIFMDIFEADDATHPGAAPAI